MILYASKYGSVREYVARIVTACDSGGLEPNAARPLDVATSAPEARRALETATTEPALIVAPVYAGRLHGAVDRFLDSARASLESRPVAIALACLYRGEEAEKQLVNCYPAWLVGHSAKQVVIGGRIRIAELRPLVRFFFRRFLRVSEDIDQFDDRWVAELADWLRSSSG